ncbi:MAG: DUF4907 domain-containing protein [Chitinophagaceae bacterium]|nr:DUF4907 domain-containing protein [Chitinophagaceae bacterium]
MKAFQLFLSRQLLVGVIFLILYSCNHADETNTTENTVAGQPDNTVIKTEDNTDTIHNAAVVVTKKETELPAGFKYTIIESEENTFGYDIYKDEKLMIHQSSIPALPGNKGFNTKEMAASVAHLVIEKINKGEMPPTVSPEELKTLGVQIDQ